MEYSICLIMKFFAYCIDSNSINKLIYIQFPIMSRELSEHERKNRATQQKLRRPCSDNSIARNRGWFAAAMGKASVLIPQKAGG